MNSSPNIVWVVLESTRFDHTSLSDYDRDTTPNLARISQSNQGRSFSNCFAHSNWTRASMASMLTGTYVSHHGAGLRFDDKIPDQLPTVAEYLRDHGYHTVCLPSNGMVSDSSGLDRGFVEHQIPKFTRWMGRVPMLNAPPRIAAKYALNIKRHSGGLTLNGMKHSTDYVITELLKRKLSNRKTASDPVFGVIHLSTPHHPYAPPLSYLDTYTEELPMSPLEAREFVIEVRNNVMEHIANGCSFDDDEWATIKAMYDATIAYVDHLVGDLFDFITSELDDTVFVVTADHGELFGEQGMMAHKLVLNDAVTNVPLVVHGPTGITDYNGELIQHIDLMRTLLAEVGAEHPTVQGYDLTQEERPYCVMQRGEDRAETNLEKIIEINPAFDASRYHRGLLTALRTTSYRYERSDSARRLYRLPDETEDRSEVDETVCTELDDELSEFLETEGQPVYSGSQAQALSDEVKRQLSDLGYLVDG